MTALIAQFGPIGVFMLMVPESACIPVPSEITLLFAGFAVSQHWMSLPLAVAAATAGNLGGSLIAYALGASRAPQHTPPLRWILDRSQRLLSDRPLRDVFLARLLPLARTFVSLPAGYRHVPLPQFISVTVAGCALWAAGFILAGDAAGAAWQSVSSLAGKLLLASGLLVLAGLAWRAHRRAKQAAATRAEPVSRRRR